MLGQDRFIVRQCNRGHCKQTVLFLPGTAMAALKFRIIQGALKAARHAGTKNVEVRKKCAKPDHPVASRGTAAGLLR